MLTLYHSGQFSRSYGSYDLNLGSDILILGGDIGSRTCPNIDDSYGIFGFFGDDDHDNEITDH